MTCILNNYQTAIDCKLSVFCQPLQFICFFQQYLPYIRVNYTR